MAKSNRLIIVKGSEATLKRSNMEKEMGGDHGNHCIEEEEEEEEEEEGTAGRTSRIFVGGLGGNVSGNDLVKIFSSLGTVKAVDIVRTKGRSFAYLDFLPSSLKSLPKLFSTYNGCVWKGGRLRLEKAKEHYLVRLRREWDRRC
ncbi:hypothetical protein L1049_022004 [Liquidambar formosana]|uniref:RRM domain-containing protein n=1 Tax=Liquidambar formosana TaxID=63359 RepID=A0AAP0RBS3_LIQFO